MYERWEENPDARLEWLTRMSQFFDASLDDLSAACGSAPDGVGARKQVFVAALAIVTAEGA